MCRQIGVTDNTYYRWRKEYVGIRTDQAKRLKELKKENAQPQNPDDAAPSDPIDSRFRPFPYDVHGCAGKNPVSSRQACNRGNFVAFDWFRVNARLCVWLSGSSRPQRFVPSR